MTVASATGHQWVQTTPVTNVTSGNGGNQTSSQQTSASPAQSSPPYFSPATHVDPSTGIAVLVVLDDQGKIMEQFPSQQVVDEYRRHQGTGGATPSPSPAASGQAQDSTPSVQAAAAQSSGGSSTPGQNQGSTSSSA